MPLTTLGEGFRSFSEPAIFEAETTTQVEQIEIPTDKAFAFVAADNGSSDFGLWKFDLASSAVASATVLVPLNPLFSAVGRTGRWIKIPTGGGTGSGGLQNGSGSPEGVADASDGQFYWDTDAAPDGQALYANLATSGTTGWFLLLQF